MADERGEYNIEKTALEIKRDVRNIERELSKLAQERLNTLEKYALLDKRLLENLEKQYDKVEKIGKDRISLEEKIGRMQEKVALIGNDIIRKRGETVIRAHKTRLRNLVAQQEMEKTIADDMKDHLAGIQKVLDAEHKRIEDAQQFLGTHVEIFKYQTQYYNILKKTIPKIGEAAIGWAAVFSLVQTLFGLFAKMDEDLAKFRIEMGMMRSDVGRISRDIKDVATNFAAVGVITEGARIAAQRLGEELGGIRVISKDLIEDTAILKAQLGVAEENSAGFLRNMAAVGRTTAQAQRRMVYFADELTAAAGIPLNTVMQDVAKMSSNALSLISRMPMQLVKAATEARRMGTSLNKMADASAQLMNFTESVQDEMEASVLVGTGINVQLARELSYRGELVKSTKAMLSEARRLNFMAMDFFQKQAFARAFGRSVEELTKMVTLQKQLEAARTMDGLKEEVALLDKLNAMREDDLKNETLQREIAVKREANQARLAALQQQWNQLLMEAMRVLFPVFDTLLKIAIVAVKIGPPLSFIVLTVKSFSLELGKVAKLWRDITYETGHAAAILSKYSYASTRVLAFLHNIVKVINIIVVKLVNAFSVVGGVISKVLSPLSGVFNTLLKPIYAIGRAFSAVVSIVTKFVGWIGKLSGITSILSKFTFLATFAKAVPVIGWVITAFQFIYNIFQRLQGFTEIWKTKGPGHALLFGLKAVGLAVYDTLIKPFVEAAKWIWSWFGGKSPSKLGLAIVKGLFGVQIMLAEALMAPFKKAWSWIMGIFGGKSPSELGLFVVKGIIGIQTKIFDALTYPWRMFLAWVTSKIPFMGGIAEKIKGGAEGALEATGILEKKAVTPGTSAKVTPEATPLAKTKITSEATPEQQKQKDGDSVTLIEILKSIRTLNDNMMSGKIGIFIDGQLLSATLARQTAFRGGYGTNNINMT